MEQKYKGIGGYKPHFLLVRTVENNVNFLVIKEIRYEGRNCPSDEEQNRLIPLCLLYLKFIQPNEVALYDEYKHGMDKNFRELYTCKYRKVYSAPRRHDILRC